MKGFRLGAGVSLAALLAATATQAQTVSEVEVVGARVGALNLTETNTTGSRLGVSALETPASIEVLSGELIRSKGDFSIADAVSRATGIVAQNNPGNGGTGNYAARGFSGVGSVMVLNDGMRMFVGAGTVSFPFDTFTVDRVEVLRGPASIMYGQGAIGGAVNVVPKRAGGDRAQYEVQAGYGTDNTYRIGVGAGAPVGDRLGVRLDVNRAASDGYVRNGDSDSWAVSGSVRLQATDSLSMLLSSDYGDRETDRYFGVPLINGKIDPRTRELNYNAGDSTNRYRDSFTQLRTEWTPSETVRLRNSTYYLRSDREWKNIETYSFLPATNQVERNDYILIRHNQRQVGNVVDLAVDHQLGDYKNTLVIGGEYNRTRFQHQNNGFVGGPSFVDAFAPAPGVITGFQALIPRYRAGLTQWALFLEDRLELSEKVSLIAGLRHDQYHGRRINALTGAVQGDSRLDYTAWRVGGVYQPTANVSIYAQYTTGADPVGSLLSNSGANAAAELTTGKQVEVGVKGVSLGGRAEWTLAAYKITKDNLFTRDRNNPGVSIQVGSQSSKGIEASLSLALGGGFSIDANGTLLDADYEDFFETVAGAAVSRAGLTPPGVPEESANVWLNWAFAPGFKVYGGARYVGKQYGDTINSAANILPSYTVADLGAEWAFRPNLALNVQVFNVFDRVYGQDTYGAQQWILGRPRAFEVRLSGRF